jgi:hypothetical protein
MTDINDIVGEARTALGAGYDKDTLAGYALPRLSADQIDAPVRWPSLTSLKSVADRFECCG